MNGLISGGFNHSFGPYCFTEMKIVKSCSVTFRSEGIYVSSSKNTPYGLVANIPMDKFATDVSLEVLGRRVLELLASIPEAILEIDLKSHGELHREHLRSLGFENGDAFEKRSKSLSVQRTGERLSVVPYTAYRSGGYVASSDKSKFCSPEPEELGRLIFEQKNECG
jgi:hypothetical protein